MKRSEVLTALVLLLALLLLTQCRSKKEVITTHVEQETQEQVKEQHITQAETQSSIVEVAEATQQAKHKEVTQTKTQEEEVVLNDSGKIEKIITRTTTTIKHEDNEEQWLWIDYYDEYTDNSNVDSVSVDKNTNTETTSETKTKTKKGLSASQIVGIIMLVIALILGVLYKFKRQ